MGKSAKFHKRSKKIASSSAGGGSTKPEAVASAKKRASLKDKATTKPSPSNPAKSSAPASTVKAQNVNGSAKRKPGDGGEGHILGGADYVTLMMGSRRKAREEAKKLPRDEEDGVEEAMEE
ncbi:uncharacterized protein STEHIDRAFT_111654 [Stereum hirsutum FP-91666 SS1]|uniref:uncharacterized protein n=1 Tax=Stereum hirsutum (strain FP-91666) TaxID=721885 RepID=UPI000444A282|nr:uncharacterized protein STEHIDRAFT_111654 [Stereum hirsutum FP-91666 SS1]EIM86121.1 hypothetical protein STEHIDRAFT_111654 [Stereum hirsutum FP-91666 SS1]